MKNNNKVFVVVYSEAEGSGTFELVSEYGAFEDLEEAKVMAETLNLESERHGQGRWYLVVGLYLQAFVAPTKHLYSVHLTSPGDVETLQEPLLEQHWEQLELFR